MAKVKQDEVLSKITPDEIDDVVLPSLKNKKNTPEEKEIKNNEATTKKLEEEEANIKKEPKKSLKEVLEKVYAEEVTEEIEKIPKKENTKPVFDRKFVARKISKDKIFVLLFLFIFIGIGVYSGVQIVLWKIDSDKTIEQIDMINETVVVEEIEDTDDT